MGLCLRMMRRRKNLSSLLCILIPVKVRDRIIPATQEVQQMESAWGAVYPGVHAFVGEHIARIDVMHCGILQHRDWLFECSCWGLSDCAQQLVSNTECTTFLGARTESPGTPPNTSGVQQWRESRTRGRVCTSDRHWFDGPCGAPARTSRGLICVSHLTRVYRAV